MNTIDELNKLVSEVKGFKCISRIIADSDLRVMVAEDVVDESLSQHEKYELQERRSEDTRKVNTEQLIISGLNRFLRQELEGRSITLGYTLASHMDYQYRSPGDSVEWRSDIASVLVEMGDGPYVENALHITLVASCRSLV